MVSVSLSLTPLSLCQPGRAAVEPSLDTTASEMSDKGLSDDAAAAACKDGDAITKVRNVFLSVN